MAFEIDTTYSEPLLDSSSDGVPPLVIEAVSGQAVNLPAGFALTTADFPVPVRTCC